VDKPIPQKPPIPKEVLHKVMQLTHLHNILEQAIDDLMWIGFYFLQKQIPTDHCRVISLHFARHLLQNGRDIPRGLHHLHETVGSGHHGRIQLHGTKERNYK
jgi:hypothetical protein